VYLKFLKESNLVIPKYSINDVDLDLNQQAF